MDIDRSKSQDAPVEYEAPTITEIGSLHEITLTPKFLNRDDGFTFMGTGATIGS